MTLSVRNGLLALVFSVLLLATLGYGALAFLLLSREGWGAPVGPGSLVQLLVSTAPAPLGSLAGFLLARQAYRKSSASEDFFVALFLATLAGETLLAVQAWVGLGGLPSFYTALLTRTVWALRFTGLFLLFIASLFAFDFPYRKFLNLTTGALAAGIFLAVLVPLQSSSARNHLLFAVGDAPGMVLVTILMAAVILGNFFLAALKPGAPSRAWARAWGVVFLLAGWSLAIITAPWGLLLAGPGIVLVAWKAEENPLNG